MVQDESMSRVEEAMRRLRLLTRRPVAIFGIDAGRHAGDASDDAVRLRCLAQNSAWHVTSLQSR